VKIILLCQYQTKKMRTYPYLEREIIHGSGIYCFFPFDSLDRHKKGVFKIGMAGNFDNRIRSYHTYLPQGFYYKCFLNKPSLKKNGLDTFRYYVMIEREIFNNIVANGGQIIHMAIRKKNRGETEWIYASEKMIEDAFDAAYEKYGGKHTDLEIGDLHDLDKARAELKKNSIFRGEIYFTA